MATTSKPNVNARLMAAMAAIGDIEKAGHNDFHNYDFVRSTDVTREVRKALIANGVAVHISTTGSDIEVVPARDGKTAIMAVAWGTIAFVNTDDPQDIVVDEWRGLAVDSSDKALAKATTSGLKYGLMNALLISSQTTDGDNESPEVGDMRRQAQDAYADMMGDPGPAAPRTHSDAPVDPGKCPIHHKEWRSNSRGWYCATKVADGWCDKHPSSEWQAAHER